MHLSFEPAKSARNEAERALPLHVISLRRANRRERARYAAQTES
jgi:uncharacterized DUF497 family protein